MAHTFDHKLVAPHRTIVQRGIVTMLSGLLRANGGYLQAVIPWGGVIRGWQDSDGIELLNEALGKRSPAIAVSVGDASAKPIGPQGFNYTEDLEVALYFFSTHVRDITEGRLLSDGLAALDDTRDPGLHVAMAHAKELIVGQYAGAAIQSSTIKGVRYSREEELTSLREVSIWIQTYSVTVATNINPNRNVTTLLAELWTRLSQEEGERRLRDGLPLKPSTIDTDSQT